MTINAKKMMQNIKSTINNVLESIQRLFCVKESLFILFVVIIAYSFSLFNRTISVDDLARNMYIGEGRSMIRATRWMFWFVNRLFSTVYFQPFIDDFVALLFLILSGMLIAIIIDNIRKDEGRWIYIVFVSAYVTYPLINELWEYTGTCLAVYFGISSSALALLYYLNLNEKTSLLDYILMGGLLTPSMSSYEVGVFFYITLVFVILYLRYIRGKRNWLIEGIKLAIPLIFAIFFRVSIGYILIHLNNVSYMHNGDTGIKWKQYGFDWCFNEIYIVNKQMYLYAAADYFPITIFALATCIYIIISIINFTKKQGSIFLSLLLMLTLFFQSVLQGYHLPYRTTQPIQLFVAFVFYLILISISEKYYLKNILACVLLFICFRQSVCLSDYLTLNNQRSDNEAMLINTIGYRLYSEFDNTKPIVFCGRYKLGDTIERKIKNTVETDVQSVINWSMVAYDSQDMMRELFSYYGYDIVVVEGVYSQKNLDDYNQLAINNNMKPLDILELNDFILVYFGK